MEIQRVVQQIRTGQIRLPPFQRGYEWDKGRVIELMDSLYRLYPVGIITFWEQPNDEGQLVTFIVDGQQRLSTIYTCYTDQIPAAYNGTPSQPHRGLCFDPRKEADNFIFPSRSQHTADHALLKVCDILQDSQENYYQQLENWQINMESAGYSRQDLRPFESNINRVRSIRERIISEQTVDQGLETDDVIKIFRRINKNGKSPGRGDLELAWIVARWTEAKTSVNEEIQRWKNTPIEKAINTDSIIRSMEAVHTGRYRPGDDAFRKSTPSSQQLQEAFNHVAAAHTEIHTFLRNDLGFKEPRKINSSTPMTILAKYLIESKNRFPTRSEKAKAIGYFLTSSALPIYHGSTATQIDADLRAVDYENPWGALHESAERKIGEIRFGPERFNMNRRASGRFLCIIDMLRYKPSTLDFLTKLPIRTYEPTELEDHHIFPRIHLQERGTDTKDIESIANIAVITADSNRKIGDRAPADYLAEIDNEDPNVLAEHCIPQNRPLWRIENYEKFLEARRQLLAERATTIIDGMRNGILP